MIQDILIQWQETQRFKVVCFQLGSFTSMNVNDILGVDKRHIYVTC